VRAAWRLRLAEYHPDRFAAAGEKIKRMAESESQKINAAFVDIKNRFRGI
jgi:DnaJ-domain-containing protein 1